MTIKLTTIPNSDPENKISGDGKPFTGTIKHDVFHKMPDGKYCHLMLIETDGINKYYTDGQLSSNDQPAKWIEENTIAKVRTNPIGRIVKTNSSLWNHFWDWLFELNEIQRDVIQILASVLVGGLIVTIFLLWLYTEYPELNPLR